MKNGCPGGKGTLKKRIHFVFGAFLLNSLGYRYLKPAPNPWLQKKCLSYRFQVKLKEIY
ncbi:hypothetical protein DCCM_3106 [Desulfocucumis palustris]|uniref:Uncharacterized protein n=1 Tax=Desulfocucumis palustris TaxID=1898651 RepID=A0A2L2XCP2_9FIRM|nr:hypothetical protein DCCM_3106 [Desulfocucumis palustris]